MDDFSNKYMHNCFVLFNINLVANFENWRVAAYASE